MKPKIKQALCLAMLLFIFSSSLEFMVSDEYDVSRIQPMIRSSVEMTMSDDKGQSKSDIEFVAQVNSIVFAIKSDLSFAHKILEEKRYRQRHDLSNMLNNLNSELVDLSSPAIATKFSNKFVEYRTAFNQSGVSATVKEECNTVFDSTQEKLNQILKLQEKTIASNSSGSFDSNALFVAIKNDLNSYRSDQQVVDIVIYSSRFISIFLCVILAFYFKSSHNKSITNIQAKLDETTTIVNALTQYSHCPLAVATHRGNFLWANNDFKKAFNLEPSTDIAQMPVSKLDRQLVFIKNSFSDEKIVQISDLVSGEFVLKKSDDDMKKLSILSLFPLVNFYREFLEGRKLHSVDMELGEGVFILQNLIEELVLESTIDLPTSMALVDGKLPILIHGDEECYSRAISAALGVAAKISSKTTDKKVKIEVIRTGERVNIIFEIPSFQIADGLVDEFLGGKKIAKLLHNIEHDSSSINASVGLKNIRYEDETRCTQLSLSFNRRVAYAGGQSKQRGTKCVL